MEEIKKIELHIHSTVVESKTSGKLALENKQTITKKTNYSKTLNVISYFDFVEHSNKEILKDVLSLSDHLV